MAPTSQYHDLCKQAKRAIRSKKYDEAVHLFQQALKINGSQIPAHEGIATAYFLKDDFERAAEHFEEITRIDRWNAQAYVNLGAVYNRVQEHSKAIEVLQKALQRNSRSAEAYYNMAIAHRHLGQPSLSVSAYREAIRLNPEMVDAHVNLANIYREMGNYNQALVHYQKALDVQPKFDRALRGRKKTELAMQKFREGAGSLMRILEAPEEGPADETQHAQHDSLSQLSKGHLPPEWDDIRRIVAEVIKHGHQMLNEMETDLHPTLMALNRTVIRGTDPQEKVIARHDEVHRAIERCLISSRKLESHLDDMRDYESLFAEQEPAGDGETTEEEVPAH